MSPREYAILNALVTFAAENVPGGLSEDERKVAKKVGRWTLHGNEHLNHLRAVLRGYRDAGLNPIALWRWHLRVRRGLQITDLGDRR